MMIRTNGHIVANALMRAGSRFQPGVDEVTQLFGGTLGGAALARSVVRFNDGDFEAAAYIALPLVERRCRELLLAVNSPIYRVQREKSPATYPGLGALLAALADHALDPSWHRFLRAFFSAPNGFNLRNEARRAPVRMSEEPLGDDEEYIWQSTVEYRPIMKLDDDMAKALEKMQRMDELTDILPGLDCGACGAPSCRALAEDIVMGNAILTDCIIKLREKVDELESGSE